MTNHTDLVARLREGKFARLQKAGPYPDQFIYAVDKDKIHLKAADLIESQAKERDEAKGNALYWENAYDALINQRDAALKDVEAAEAEVARLREALGLIAIVEQGCGGTLTFREMAESAMRQARSALERGE
jgi:hypothetical protein